METDRPGITETPFTIDAGHFQYETDLLSFEKESLENKDQKTFLFNHFNFKAGITNSLDLQVGLESFGSQQEIDAATGIKQTKSGTGNINIRLKQNLLGNFGGDFAISLLPYINIPTAKYESDSRFEAGFILPMELKLPNEWKLSMQLEGDRLKDKEADALHTEFLQSLTISREIVKDLDAMAETYYTYNFKDRSWSNYLNGALQFGLGENVKMDAGLNYGLQHDAKKTYYLGMAFRF
ncbi:MAG: hypothetical protein JWQ28_882 [Pedobacter sp.]|nr:hypothetical protein [Pedobacter sp.]